MSDDSIQVLHKNDFQADRIWGGLQIFGLWTHFGRVYFRFSARAQRAGNLLGVVFKNTGGVVYVCEMTCVIYLPHIILGIGLRVGLLQGDVRCRGAGVAGQKGPERQGRAK